MAPPRTMLGDLILNYGGGLAPCAYVLDQGALGPNLYRAQHRAPHGVGGDTMGCLEAGISAAVRRTVV